ncbi:hypothetical protein KC878_00440 [Candidatus Saccharibacteria bacterium]|nr:hypothetical protein [Candidatus Saccharibacteria bacterium]MCB9821249.1 hypothetical protein [Candidatus Nomurabacteria bacterium]
MLTDTVIKMLLGAHQAIIPVSRLQDSVFNTLRHFEPPAALKYVTDRSRHISKAELRNKIKDLDLA